MPAESMGGRVISRRRFLQGGAAAAAAAAFSAYLPVALRDAIAGSLEDDPAFDVSQVKHVVLMMLENRSFDHYFGTLSGVAGFSDSSALVLPGGQSVFHQPDPGNPDGYMLPFHIDSTSTDGQAMPSLSHAWQIQHAAWNGGAMDGWIRAHVATDSAAAGPYTMGYFEQSDIPFQYALANAFTICDHYHCSVMGPTHPNRYMQMTGTLDPTGAHGGPALDNNETFGDSPYNWTTMAQFLQNAGVSWKCYQQLYATNTSGTQPYSPSTMSSLLNNYETNVILNIQAIQNAPQNVPFGLYQNAAYGSTLFGSTNGNGLGGRDTSITNPYTGQPFDLTTNFEEDCYNGTLPSVSWIFPPAENSEHPSYLPAAGAEFVASKVAAVAANAQLWNSTVFILHYDENDGQFDHVPPITPPRGTPDEFVSLESPGGTPGGGYPVGSGFRVPCIIVSPWTVGGYVSSEPFDHISTLQFIEQVFLSGRAVNTNISAWRRETFGDLTSAFQSGPGAGTPPSDPNFTYSSVSSELDRQTANTSGSTKLPAPVFPRANQTAPSQVSGSRPQAG
jgi:phospholipase C